MRTKDEFYNYCMKYGYCNINSGYLEKMCKNLETALSAREQVELCFVGAYKFRMNFTADYGMYALTDSNLIVVKRGFFGYDYTKYARNRITRVSHSRGTVVITVENEGNFDVTIEDSVARDIVQRLQDILFAKKESINTASKADELIKLKALLDSGVLTQEEFDREKQKVLNS